MTISSVDEVLDQFTARILIEKVSGQLLAGIEIEATDTLMRQLADGELFAPVMRLWVNALRTCRHFSREASWREEAVERGVDAYEAGRLLAVLWLSGDNAAVRVKAPVMRKQLRNITFSRHGDQFHLEKVEEIILGLEALIAYDNIEIELEDPRLTHVHSFIISTLYEGLWQAHNALEGSRAARLARLYIHLVNNDELAEWAERQFIIANGFAPCRFVAPTDARSPQPDTWATLRGQAETVPSQDDADDLLARALKILHLPKCGGLFEPGHPEIFLGFLRKIAQRRLWKRQAGSLLTWLDEATNALAPHVAHECWGLLNGTLNLFRGFALECIGKDSEAVASVRKAASTPVPFLPEEFQQGVDFLIARGWRQEARAIIASGIREMRAVYSNAGLNACISARNSRDPCVLPARGLVLSGWGVGDDILRLGLLIRLKGSDNNFTYVLDPRIAPLARRALPAMRFLSASRIGGAIGGTRAEYWAERAGVPINLPPMRFTSEIYHLARRMVPDLYLGEELLLAWYDAHETPGVSTASTVLAVTEEARHKAREWLHTLPTGRPAICLAWRSGDLAGERARHFFSLPELTPLIRACNANWINVQYGWNEAELDAAARCGAHLYTMPDLNIRDDFDTLGALMLESTLTIAPRLSTRDFAGALGAHVLSLSVGYPDIEAWRLAKDGKTDLVFPSIQHITEGAEGGRQGVLESAAMILRSSPLNHSKSDESFDLI